MEFLFRKALALIGKLDDPAAQKELFDRFGGGDDLLDLYERMERVVGDPRIGAPDVFESDFPDPNMVAGYLDHPSEKSRYQRLYEESCLSSDPLLAEAASASVILNLYQEKPTRAPKSCRRRAYLVGSPQSASKTKSVSSSGLTSRKAASSRASRPFSSDRSGAVSESNPFDKKRNLVIRRGKGEEFPDGIDAADETSSPFRGDRHFDRRSATPESVVSPPKAGKKKRDVAGYLLFILFLSGILCGFGPQLLQILKKTVFESVSTTHNNVTINPSEILPDAESEFFRAPLSEKIATTPTLMTDFPDPSEFQTPQTPKNQTPSPSPFEGGPNAETPNIEFTQNSEPFPSLPTESSASTSRNPTPWKSLSLLSEEEKAARGIGDLRSLKTPLQKDRVHPSLMSIPSQNNNVFKDNHPQ